MQYFNPYEYFILGRKYKFLLFSTNFNNINIVFSNNHDSDLCLLIKLDPNTLTPQH